jgi:hypothetical protein
LSIVELQSGKRPQAGSANVDLPWFVIGEGFGDDFHPH